MIATTQPNQRGRSSIGAVGLTYRPDIDGLRAVAVLAVVLNHLSASLLPGGYVGVDVFFVISGYLITSIISREIAEGRFTFAGFYQRRARRIFPALFAMLLVTLAVSYSVLLPSDMSATLRGALGTVFFASNMVFWREMKEGYFAATDSGLNPLLHTWSLSVEEQFYVFFPVLLLLCFKYARRYIPLILVACAVASLAAAALLIQSKSVAVFFLAPFRAWELLAGSLLALNVIPALRSRFWRELCAAAGLVAILVACFAYDHKTTFPGMAAVVPVLGAAAVIHAGASGSTWVARLLQLRPMVYVGLISYSLYLWHWPLIVLARYVMEIQPSGLYVFLLLMASLVLAYLSYYFIERSFRRRADMTARLAYTSFVACTLTIVLVSSIGIIRKGFEGRFTSVVIELDKARWPNIPYQHCNAKPTDEWCALGVGNNLPVTLFWGDSHLLSWAPALNKIMAHKGQQAIFVKNSACPPLLGIVSNLRPKCEEQNLAVKKYLLANPSIKNVVMAGYWTSYFNSKDEIGEGGDGQAQKDEKAVSNALSSTIRWLRQNGREIVLLGPVPVFDRSVPLALALEKTIERTSINSSEIAQRRKNAAFLKVVEDEISNDVNSSLRFLDPIHWLCTPHCATTLDGQPLYRDSHHLSVFGAMMLEPKLNEELKFLSSR